MMLPLLLSLFISVVSGFLFLCILWPYQRAVRSNLLIKICLTVGLGIGISSCSFFLWLAIFGPLSKSFVIAEVAILLCLVTIFVYTFRKRNYPEHLKVHPRVISKWQMSWVLEVSFYIMLLFAIVTFIFTSLLRPHGGWDAWAIWNMRARFLFRAGDQWRVAFSGLLPWSHPDNPLLIPGMVARCWKYVGSETVAVPVLLSMLFTFATVGLTFSSLSILRSKSQGFLAGLVLLGTPFFIESGSSQYADVPLGFFFLATIVLFCLQDRLSRNNYNLLFLAGMTTGFSAWTKNEGLLFLVSIIIARFAVIVLVKGWKTYLRQMFFFTIGLMPILTIIIYFKTQFAPPNVLLSPQQFQFTINRLLDFSRYFLICKVFAREIIHFGNWVVNVVPLLAFYLLLLRIKIEEKHRPSISTCLIALCLMLVGYFFVYVVTPFDLLWHLSTSLKRLFLQLWPSFIFAYFLIVCTPEHAVMRVTS